MPFGPWCWERLSEEGEEGIRGWDDWMASSRQWTWTWTNFRRWWGTERPGMLQSIGSQRFGHDGVTEQQGIFYCHHHLAVQIHDWHCSQKGTKGEREGKKERGRQCEREETPCLHTLSSSQDPLFPILLETERCPLEVLLFTLLLCFRTSVARQVKVKR